MKDINSNLYKQKAVESFYLERPYGIRIDFSEKGYVLFNRKLNLLGVDKWNSIEELPLEKSDILEEIPLEGAEVKMYEKKVDIFFYTDKSNPYQNGILNMDSLRQYNKYIYPLSILLDRVL